MLFRSWADGGETRLDNLVLLCRRHHRAVHEEGFRVEIATDTEGKGEGRGGGNLRFYWPDGHLFPDVPPTSQLPHDPVVVLEAEHSKSGIRIDPETGMSLWGGEPFDVGYAIYALRHG